MDALNNYRNTDGRTFERTVGQAGGYRDALQLKRLSFDFVLAADWFTRFIQMANPIFYLKNVFKLSRERPRPDRSSLCQLFGGARNHSFNNRPSEAETCLSFFSLCQYQEMTDLWDQNKRTPWARNQSTFWSLKSEYLKEPE